MAPSEFRGRRPETAHVYDEAGRLVRTVPGSRWTPEDRALLLAYKAHQSTICKGCGQSKADAWHPDNDGWYDQHRFTCHACTAQNHDPSAKGPQQPTVYAVSAFTRDLTVDPYPKETP